MKKDQIINCLLSLQFIFRPTYWLSNHRYSKKVDTLITELLDKYEFEVIPNNPLEMKLGNIKVWVANQPYGAITLPDTPLEEYRPSRLTISRALKRARKVQREHKATELSSWIAYVGLKQSLEDKVRNAVNLKHRFKIREVILFAPQDGTFKDVMTGSEITADMLMQYEHTLYDNKGVLWL